MLRFRSTCVVGTAVLTALPLLAHDETARAAFAWSFEPLVVIPLAVSAALFAMGAVRRRARPGCSWPQVIAFTSGWVTLVVALVSPVHRLGGELFSIHMTQHELLMIVAAPLLVLSRPLVWFLWALPVGWREVLGRAVKTPPIAAGWVVITRPMFAWLLHGATLWMWHIPRLYDASVENEWVHAAQHTTFLVTALLFWWTLIHGRHGRLGHGAAVMYVFTTAMHTSILGALMTFARQTWYPIYLDRTTAFHLTPLQDQQLGGLIMWIPAGVIYIILGLWLLAECITESGQRVAYTRAAQPRMEQMR